MRKLKIANHISLDGVIQVGALDDDKDFPYGDWSGPYRTPEGRDAVLAAYGGKFDILLGRRTYDYFSSFWPKMPSCRGFAFRGSQASERCPRRSETHGSRSAFHRRPAKATRGPGRADPEPQVRPAAGRGAPGRALQALRRLL